MPNLYEFWRGLDKQERVQFCANAKIAYGYMESHLIHGRKRPSMEKIQAIVDASNQQLTHKSLFEFFLKDPTAA